MSLKIFLRFIGFGLAISAVMAEVLRVPSEYPTIQSALSSLQDHDTVFVDTGLYAEALHAPPLSFILKGNVILDTGDYPRPIIDPSILNGSNALACLELLGGEVVIEDFMFRNGPQMFPRNLFAEGGIPCRETQNLVLRRCVMDSVFRGISFFEAGSLDLENCSFHLCENWCVLCARGSVVATECFFSGPCFEALLVGGSNSVITRCRFRDNQEGKLMRLSGGNMMVSECTFGPSSQNFFNEMVLFSFQTWGTIEGNEFIGMHTPFTVLEMESDSIHHMIIRNNHFSNVHCRNEINLRCYDFESVPHDTIPEIRENFFEGYPQADSGRALFLIIPTKIVRNHFSYRNPSSNSAVCSWVNRGQGQQLRDNMFSNTGIAASTSSNAFQLDATNNYWGDPTGPYNANLNPLGQGDSVGNNVLFTPWYTDTSFFNLSSDEPFIPHPSSFILTAYPNPFNPFATLSFDLDQASFVKLIIFDIAGREVKTLLNRIICAGEHRVQFDGRELPSGIYLTRIETGQVTKTVKLVLLK